MDAVNPPRTRRPWRTRAVFVARALRMACACALLAAIACAAPAAASVLYRCTGAGGETAYVSNTAGYHACTRLGEWPTRAAHAAAPDHAAPRKIGQPSGSVLPGKPPHAVAANPAVLTVTPLGEGASIKLDKLVQPSAWQPLPLALLDTLGAKLLPRMLGVTAPEPPASAPSPAPATPATTAIPLKLDDDAAKPPRTGAVYKVVQKNGTVLYTNVAALAQGKESKMLFTYIIECYACDIHSRINWNTVPLHLAEYRDAIHDAARATGVDAALLRAVIHAESGFNPMALSYKGAQGLMQLMPGTASDLGVGDAFDPTQNIAGGARYLAMLLHDFHGDVKLAAAGYNAGAGAVSKYGGVPPYAETEVYVKRVALLYERYRKALADRASPALATARRGG